jgi:ribosomal protein S18 acetylase RimI-like enzyme
MGVEIAAMTPADFDQALALWRVTPGVGINDADTPKGIHALLERNPGLSQVARLNGEIIGTVLCGHDGRRGYLYHLAVAAAHRSRGLGRSLVEAALARLAACGIRKCHIFVYAHNTGGESFWRQTGWVERTELKIMSRDLVLPGEDES